MNEPEFAWNTPESRWQCFSLVASLIYIKNLKPEEALEQSLNKFSINGDLIGRVEREGVLIDACMLAKDAWWDAKREREEQISKAREERRGQARKKAM